MEEIIRTVFRFFEYKVVETWEDEDFFYTRIEDSIISYIVLKELIKEGFRFFISTEESKGGYLVIEFFKE